MKWGLGSTDLFEGLRKSGCWREVFFYNYKLLFFQYLYFLVMWMCLIIIETRFTIIIIIIIIIIITIIIITVIIMISTWWATARTDLPEQRRFCLVGANMSSDSPGLLSWSWSFCWCWLSWSWSFCWLLTEPMLCYGDQLVIIMIKIRIHLQNRGVFKDGPERRSLHLPYLKFVRFQLIDITLL